MLHGSCASLPAAIVMLKMGETNDGRSSLGRDEERDDNDDAATTEEEEAAAPETGNNASNLLDPYGEERGTSNGNIHIHSLLIEKSL